MSALHEVELLEQEFDIKFTDEERVKLIKIKKMRKKKAQNYTEDEDEL